MHSCSRCGNEDDLTCPKCNRSNISDGYEDNDYYCEDCERAFTIWYDGSITMYKKDRSWEVEQEWQ